MLEQPAAELTPNDPQEAPKRVLAHAGVTGQTRAWPEKSNKQGAADEEKNPH